MDVLFVYLLVLFVPSHPPLSMRWLIWKSLSIQLSDVKPAKPGGKWTQSKVWLSIPGILWGFFKDSLDILWRFVHSLKIWFSWRSLRDLDSIWIRFGFDLDSIWIRLDSSRFSTIRFLGILGDSSRFLTPIGDPCNFLYDFLGFSGILQRKILHQLLHLQYPLTPPTPKNPKHL